MKNIDIVSQEVQRAYADDNYIAQDKSLSWAIATRQLMFRASKALSVKQAIQVLQRFVSNSNDFAVAALELLPKTAKVTLAREYSVCLYISGVTLTQEIAKKMQVNEFSEENGEYRLWWD